MPDKPKLIWHSNAPFAATGYAAQTALFAPDLSERFEFVISAFWGLQGSVIPWRGIPVLPGIDGTHGNESIREHVDAVWGPGKRRNGLVVTLMDVWVLDPMIWRDLNVASWVPVDHDPVPQAVYRFFTDSGAVPIAMSKFGRDQLQDLDPLYVPHAVDTDAYKPYDRLEARAEIGMPADEFVVGIVAANKGNPSRKNFVQALQAFKAVHDRHKDTRLYIHTDAKGRFQGVDLPAAIAAVGIPNDKVTFCDQYRATYLPFDPETMAKLYSSMDVLLSPSAGEGFGIPVLEAQSCGTPVIVSDFSAQAELCGSGWKVEGERVYTPMGSWQFRPDIADIVQALDHCYSLPEASRKTHSDKAREFAMDYALPKVLEEQMLPALETARQRFSERAPVELVAA